MTTIQKLEAAKHEVAHIDERYRGLFTHGTALRLLVKEKDLEIINILATGGWPDPFNVLSDGSFVNALTTSAPMISFPILKQLLAVCEESDEFQIACRLIQPLVDQIGELEAQASTEAHAYALKLQAISAAEAAAVEKAIAAAEADPAIAKLRSQAEAVRPAHIEAPPFRGRVELAGREPEAVPA